MRPPRSRVQFTNYLPWIVFALAVVYLAIAWLWKRAFIWGDSVGPYWLFVVMDWTVLQLTIVSFAGFVSASAVWLVRLGRRESSAQSAALPSGLLLLASLVFLGACFPALISLMTPLDSLRVRGRVYYLSGITALMDNNYALFECDGVGLMCQVVYRSGDYRSDVALGNVIGSNLFNILAVLGLSAMASPLPVQSALMASDSWWMLGVTLLLFPILFTGLRVQRWEGGLLLVVYCGYLGLLLAG